MNGSDSSLLALSPLDGRYSRQTEGLAAIFSEFGLMRYRILVEVRWLQHLASCPEIPELPAFTKAQQQRLEQLHEEFGVGDARRVKAIEGRTNHDVKAIEYFIKEKLEGCTDLAPQLEFVHFACTSEDINNLAYALMVKQGIREELQPLMQEVIDNVRQRARDHAHQPMLSRTHGQPASPTTMGKEFANVAYRLLEQYEQIASIGISGKINGAVGNFNAHYAAYPEVNWPQVALNFVRSLELNYVPYTTQIEPHDSLAGLCHALCRFNTVLIDFSRDIWAYIAIDYFRQRTVADEVGSSTMPHKVNPIDFENAEGNLGMANAVLGHLADKLPVSRWQRDLSDSTVLRNLGTGFAHCCLACKSLLRGLDKLELDAAVIDADIDDCWEILAEPVQTVMRRYGIEQPYEKLKALSRGKTLTREAVQKFISGLDLPPAASTELLQLTPRRYLGNARKMAENI